MKPEFIFVIIFISLCIIDPLGNKTPKTEIIGVASVPDIVEIKTYPPLTECRNPEPISVMCKGCDANLKCTRSMIPTFSCNDTLYLCKVDKDIINIGDIIAFIYPESFNTTEYLDDGSEHIIEISGKFYVIHRVVGITENGKYITQGDANQNKDKLTTPFENVFGKVYRVDKDTYKSTKTIKIA